VLLSILLFAARRQSVGADMDPMMLGLVVLVMVIITVIYVVVEAVKKAELQKQQQKIDEAQALYYKRWHQQVAVSGHIQAVACDLILSKGEECLRVERNVTLYEVRDVRRSTHTFGSMPIGKGLRVGRGYSSSESSDEWRPIAQGALYVTNKQVYFDGDKQDRKIPISKISTIKADWSAIEISSETRQKSMVFVGVNGNICREMVLCASGQDVFN